MHLWPLSNLAKGPTAGQSGKPQTMNPNLMVWPVISFAPMLTSSESDVRFVYCAFALANMLDDWSGIDVDRSVDFLLRCRVHGFPLPLYTEM
jgi:hypothetical protein